MTGVRRQLHTRGSRGGASQKRRENQEEGSVVQSQLLYVQSVRYSASGKEDGKGVSVDGQDQFYQDSRTTAPTFRWCRKREGGDP